MGLAPLGAFTRGCDCSAKVISKPPASTGAAGLVAQRAGTLHATHELNLKAIARNATLRGDTKTLFHALDLLERVVPIATFMDFCTELRNSACKGRAHARTDSFRAGQGLYSRRYAYRSAFHRAVPAVTVRRPAPTGFTRRLSPYGAKIRHPVDYPARHDWSERFPLVVEAMNQLKVRSCLIDGEVVCCDEKGVTSFQLLRHRRNEPEAFLYAFDLVELNGADLRREPIEVRKAMLASILRKSRHGLRLNEHLAHDCGLTVFEHACQLGCEGIVSKRLGSRYRSGRSPDWLKFKNPQAPAVRREAEEDWGR